MKNKWQIAFFVCAFGLVTLLIYTAVLILDNAVSRTHGSDGYRHLQQNCKNLASFFPKGGNQKDTLVALRNMFPNAFIVEESQSINMDGLKFDFDENHKLMSIDPEGMYPNK